MMPGINRLFASCPLNGEVRPCSLFSHKVAACHYLECKPGKKPEASRCLSTSWTVQCVVIRLIDTLRTKNSSQLFMSPLDHRTFDTFSLSLPLWMPLGRVGRFEKWYLIRTPLSNDVPSGFSVYVYPFTSNAFIKIHLSNQTWSSM